MTQPFFDDATRDLFDEILKESVEEYRAEKEFTVPVPDPALDPPEVLPETVEGDLSDAAWKRLHRAMYVMTMHRGRPHAQQPDFQRKWLESALRAICVILAHLPDGDET